MTQYELVPTHIVGNWTLLWRNKLSLFISCRTTWRFTSTSCKLLWRKLFYWRIHISQGLIGTQVFGMENRVFRAPRPAFLPLGYTYAKLTYSQQLVTLWICFHHRLSRHLRRDHLCEWRDLSSHIMLSNINKPPWCL